MFFTDQVNIWLSVCSTIVAIIAAVYGLYRGWQDRRKERRELIQEMARTAVRVTEASYVRPLLRIRLKDCVENFFSCRLQNLSTVDHMLLFCDLQLRVGLTESEKLQAKVRAFNLLVEQLQSIHPSPVPLTTDSDVRQQEAFLLRRIEIAYNVQPRPANSMILDMGSFLPKLPNAQ